MKNRSPHYPVPCIQGRDSGGWGGRLMGNAVGAHLLNTLEGAEWTVAYWRDRNDEVDFVVTKGLRSWGIELKSGWGKRSGLGGFYRRFPKASTMVIGDQGVPFEQFFGESAEYWIA